MTTRKRTQGDNARALFFYTLIAAAGLLAWMLSRLDPDLQRLTILLIVIGGPGLFLVLRILTAAVRLAELRVKEAKATKATTTTAARRAEPRQSGLTITTGEAVIGRRML